MKTADFFYDLPESSIAQSAIEPRHDARLLNTRSMSDHRFCELPELLREGDLVVVNRSRVRPARLAGTRETGGAVEVLLLRALDGGRWEALARPTRRMRAGTRIRFDGVEVRLLGEPEGGSIVVEADGDLAALAEEVGEVPLPPYFHGSLADRDRYQTIFADRTGSAAAPTAGLHFTEEVVAGLAAKRIGIARIDLEVGLDTFQPIASLQVEAHRMHSERIVVSQDVVDRIEVTRSAGGRVVAIGTTVVRALETAAAGEGLAAMSGDTDLFIRPGYRFAIVDVVVTNFHIPRSTLVVLVAAVLGDRWREVYDEALRRGYRFLSFGDAMLAEVVR